MIGAIIGDTVGSIYEFNNCRRKDFPLYSDACEYTDDSLMTIAVGIALLKRENETAEAFHEALQESFYKLGSAFPDPMGGYGGMFANWMFCTDRKTPYNSYGNGSAMRVSPVADVAVNLEEALMLAKQSAEVTHNHPEGIKGAQATAAAAWMAGNGASKEEIKRYVTDTFGYDLERKTADIRKHYPLHEVTCQYTVPEALIAFLESVSFEDAIRTAVSLGGDTDTLTAICGAVAWAYYGRDGISNEMKAIAEESYRRLPKNLERFVRSWETHLGIGKNKP